MLVTLPGIVRISIHAPVRERPFRFDLNAAILPISIHAPVRERHAVLLGVPLAMVFQFTLP